MSVDGTGVGDEDRDGKRLRGDEQLLQRIDAQQAGTPDRRIEHRVGAGEREELRREKLSELRSMLERE